MALSKKQVAFIYDTELETRKEVERFIGIINKWYHTLDEYQCFHGIDAIKAQDDYKFIMTMLGVLDDEKR